MLENRQVEDRFVECLIFSNEATFLNQRETKTKQNKKQKTKNNNNNNNKKQDKKT